jgi:outer membrane receptor for ferrienterochelin and colicins
MLKRLLICLLVSIAINNAFSQQVRIEGAVYEKPGAEKKLSPLPGATVIIENTQIGSTSAADGSFSIESPVNLPLKLIVSYVGYKSDTLLVDKPGILQIYLSPSVELKTFEVEGRQESTKISTLKTINVEQITQKEILKAACCNLSESFETNPSVSVSYTNAITGAKEIQMLGLSGIYSQVMTENIPNVRGLAGTYGLAYIPGPWMESIQITKGSGSVVNGFESTTGQINVEYIKPDNADKLYLNGYVANSGNVELNAHKTFKISDKTSTILMVHGENMATKWDHQNDNFLDMPLVSNVNVFNRWSFNDGKKFEGQFGIKALSEKRRSGQKFYNWGNDADSTSGYGVQIKTNRVEAFSKTGLIFPNTPWRSVGLILSGTLHNQESYFGLKTYDGFQGSFYGSLIYMSIIGNTNHKWKAGLDMRYDDYKESYLLLPYNRVDRVPGIYAEYTLNLKDKFGLVAGSRIDYHNEWNWIYTPRLHMKYNFTPDIIVRLSAGRSFRTANVFADNISIMATSRNLEIEEQLNPERAWNYGGNFTAKFRMFYRPGSFSVDYYYTEFSNQVVVDTYSSNDKILLYNLRGTSYSGAFQIALNYEVFKRFDLRLAYKNDQVVSSSYLAESFQKPLVPKHKALLNIGYVSKKETWRYDLTMHYQGETKLNIPVEGNHVHSGHTDNQIVNNTSPDFVTLNAQITRVMGKKWEIYAGGENITDFRQETPIINANEPFGEGFDATNIWGPVMGRKLYFGFRYKVAKEKTINNLN